MLSAGILRDGQPLELIDGLLLYKDRSDCGGDPMTIGEKHNRAVQLLALLVPELLAQGVYMQTQGPIRLSEKDEPEPDGAVISGHPRDSGIPGPAKAMSVIEVADSSLEYDRTTKLSMYARAGIAQYVIVNVRDQRVEVYERPAGERYEVTKLVAASGAFDLRISAGATLTVTAERLLP